MHKLLIAVILFACPAVFAEDGRRFVDVWSGGGVFAQVVDGAEWRTSFYFHNMDSTTIYGALGIVDDKGDAMRLPFTSGSASVLQFTLSPNSTTSFETVSSGDLKQGSALVVTCDRPCLDVGSQFTRAKLGALAVFRWRATGKQEVEAVVPIELPDTSARVLFENRQGYATGFAVLNGASASDTVTITVRGSSGAVLTQESLLLDSMEKRVFMVAEKYPQAAGQHGSIHISGRAVIALGLRASPNGSLTSSHSMVPAP